MLVAGKKVRVAIIGAGAIAQRLHIPEFLKCEDAQLIAIAEVDKRKARKVAQEFQIPRIYTDWQELLEKERPDAVSVCLPNYLHAEVTIKSLEAGAHVLVEKPMATTVRETDAMVEASRRNKRLLMVSQNMRFASASEVAKQIMEKKMIGQVNTVCAWVGHGGPEYWEPNAKWFFELDKACGGALADLGIHAIDLVRYLMPTDIVEVFAYRATLEKKIPLEDNAAFIFKFSSGAIGVLGASWTLKPGKFSVEIHGTKGSLTLDPWANKLKVYLASPPSWLNPIIPPESKYGSPMRYFIHCIKKGIKPTIINGEEGARSMEVILAGFKSSQTGAPVKLPLQR